MDSNQYTNRTQDECVAEMIAFVSADVPVPSALLERLCELEATNADLVSIPTYV